MPANSSDILYADDTTLFSTIQISEALPKDINNQLAEVYNWLAVNKLSLNVKKNEIYGISCYQ